MKDRRRDFFRTSTQLLARAQEVIEFLMTVDQRYEGSRKQFGYALAEWSPKPAMWLKGNGEPDTDLIKKVFRLTRETAAGYGTEEAEDVIGGYVVCYSKISRPSVLLLSESDSGMKLLWAMELIKGDLTRQAQHKAENRQRVPVLQLAADLADRDGFKALARALHFAENEVESHGEVTTSTISTVFKELAVLGMTDE